MSNFIANSAFVDPDWWSFDFWALNYFQIIISVCVLVHSMQIHWKITKRYTFTRGAAEVSASTGLIASVLTIICHKYPTPVAISVLYDVLVCACCNFVAQLCDNWVVFERAKAIRNVSKLEEWLIKAYIALVLFAPWWLPYWLFPFFCNVNDGIMITFVYTGGKICGVGNVVYNTWYTFSFARTLYLVSSKAETANFVQSRKIKIIALKSIVHCCISNFANIWCNFIQLPDPSSGFTVYSISVTVGLHFLFNFKIENVFIGQTASRKFQTNPSSVFDQSKSPAPQVHRKVQVREVQAIPKRNHSIIVHPVSASFGYPQNIACRQETGNVDR